MIRGTKSAVSGMLTWLGICFIYTRFYAGMKAQNIDRSTLPFASPLQPYAAWYGMVWCALVCLVSHAIAPIHRNYGQGFLNASRSYQDGRCFFVKTGQKMYSLPTIFRWLFSLYYTYWGDLFIVNLWLNPMLWIYNLELRRPRQIHPRSRFREISGKGFG